MQDWVFRLSMGSNILHKFGSHIFSTGNRLEFETDLQFCPFMAILVVKFVRDTVTDLANSCVTPLFRRPQGSQGCLEKQNHPLSSNLVVWCAKI